MLFFFPNCSDVQFADQAMLQVVFFDYDVADADDYIGEVLVKLRYAAHIEGTYRSLFRDTEFLEKKGACANE
jgi:hypothetical protein